VVVVFFLPIRWSGRRAAWAALLLLAPLVSDGQPRGRGRRGGSDSPLDDLRNVGTTWTINPAFKNDVFTFVRLRHDFGGGYGYGFRARWDEDYPLADEMLSFRLHEITALQVNPEFATIDIAKDDLTRYPFAYLAGVESINFREAEAAILRNYLLNGGFIMVDYFWGDAAWTNFAQQLKRVFPDRAPVELTIDHPIFHCIYDFKTKPQMPTAGVYRHFGIFYDPNRDYDVMSHDPHYFAVNDDKGRIMMLICHNNHFGDGWEHEGDDPVYFHTISEGMAYPMFINIIFYTMGH
jgi:hypothetical protein